LPPPPDCTVVLGGTAVLYLTVIMSAKWATQLFVFLIFLFIYMPVSDNASAD
jgi:hypothetical protein